MLSVLYFNKVRIHTIHRNLQLERTKKNKKKIKKRTKKEEIKEQNERNVGKRILQNGTYSLTYSNLGGKKTASIKRGKKKREGKEGNKENIEEEKK